MYVYSLLTRSFITGMLIFMKFRFLKNTTTIAGGLTLINGTKETI
jgi:hypothetical protein